MFQAAQGFSLEEAGLELHVQPVRPAFEDLERPPREVEHQIAFGLVELLPDLVATDPTHLRAVSQIGRRDGRAGGWPMMSCDRAALTPKERRARPSLDLARIRAVTPSCLLEVYLKMRVAERVRGMAASEVMPR